MSRPYRLLNDVSRCFDAKECEMGNVCLRNDDGRVWSYFRRDNICNKDNNYKMLKLMPKGFGDASDENDEKT